MGDLPDLEKELEKEREKLNHMINEARETHQSDGEAVLEQSRKVDNLLAKVQRAHNACRGRGGGPGKDPDCR